MNALQSKLESLDVKFSADWLYLDTSEAGWMRDKWSVTIECNGKSYTDFYYMGLGHRTLCFGITQERGSYRYYSQGKGVWAKNDVEACEKGMLLVPKSKDKEYPKAWEIVYSWLGDAQCDMSFEEWANEFGYSDDSIKARDIYMHFQRIRSALRSIFGDATIAELQEAAQDC
jgi:hypothetical protein